MKLTLIAVEGLAIFTALIGASVADSKPQDPATTIVPVKAAAGSKDDVDNSRPDNSATPLGESIDSASSSPPSRIHFAGYVQPQFGIRYRPGAVPRDRTEYSADQTRAGIVVSGNPARGWHYDVEVAFGSALARAVTGSEAVDVDGDGKLDNISVYDRASSGIAVQRAAVDWDPSEHLGFSVGQMRIPLSVGNQISNTDLLFPNRAAANEIFLRGSDFGALARLAVQDSKMRVSAGVFNGTDPTTSAEREARGPLYSFRIDIDPMGEMEPGGRDTRGGEVRFGFGAGLLYYPSTTFDTAGFAGTKMRDLRAALSVRAAFSHFYFQGEILRRQRTDSLSSRPLIANGAYGQASYYIRLKPGVALSPIGRLGWSVEDKSFEPRQTLSTEFGMSLHLRGEQLRTDGMRLTLQYQGEHRTTERESAHGLVGQIQLLW